MKGDENIMGPPYISDLYILCMTPTSRRQDRLRREAMIRREASKPTRTSWDPHIYQTSLYCI